MKTQVYGLDGKALREIELSDVVFGRDVSEGSIYHAIRNELANRRLGTAKIKDRGEVQGSGKKPWKQKGTGRARAGHKRSPVWVGGGKIFGPRQRDYSYKLPRKVKRLALLSILSLKAKEDRLRVVTDFTVESGKTKDLVLLLKNLAAQERTVVILKDDDAMIRRAGRNVPWLDFLSFNRLTAHALFYCHKLLLLETAATKLNDFYGTEGPERVRPSSRAGTPALPHGSEGSDQALPHSSAERVRPSRRASTASEPSAYGPKAERVLPHSRTPAPTHATAKGEAKAAAAAEAPRARKTAKAKGADK